MSEEEKTTEAEDRKSARQKMGEGIKQGIGVLSAFKDALEETIQEARDRGDLSAERAKEVMKEALDKAQAAASGARERLDFANQAEFEALAERVSALEERVFGESAGDGPAQGEEAEDDAGGEGDGEATSMEDAPS